jgi:hypothetical protein
MGCDTVGKPFFFLITHASLVHVRRTLGSAKNVIDSEKFKTAHIGMLRSIRCLTGEGGGQRIFYLDLKFNVKSCNYGGIKVWFGGRNARQTRFLVGKVV